MSKRNVLCIDDDGDTMICTRPKGQCKASVMAVFNPEHFCLGCKNLDYEFQDSQTNTQEATL